MDDRKSQCRSLAYDLGNMKRDLRDLQSLKIALLTARPSASADKLLKVLPILQTEAFQDVTLEKVEAQGKAFDQAWDDLLAEERAQKRASTV